MIKCIVKGSAKDIMAVQSIIKQKYKNTYSDRVQEEIPEAVVHRTSVCTAVFCIHDDYFGLDSLSQVSHPEIKTEFRSGYVYIKPARSKRGFWQRRT